VTDLVLSTTITTDDPGTPTWQVTSVPPIPVTSFGKDHWSTFAYVETRTVDYRGVLEHDHMRCNEQRHPFFNNAGSRAAFLGATSSGAKYPTRCKGEMLDGKYQSQEIYDHDDYDCLDDLIAAGLLRVCMPAPDYERDCFVDAYGRPIVAQKKVDKEVLRPSFLTGMGEALVARYAVFSLTPRGARVATQLRAHKASGGNFHQFVPNFNEGEMPSE
jgi:hypothetical protein